MRSLDSALLGRNAAELVALGPDVLLARGNAAVEAVQRQTKTIPIVFTMVSDPVGMGYVESLAFQQRAAQQLAGDRQLADQLLAPDATDPAKQRRPPCSSLLGDAIQAIEI
jgi:hypothetical protein